MKIYKIIFINSMILGTLITISSYSWMSMWMGLEINLLSVIPLFSDKKNMLSSESSMKYFITQALASLVLLMAVIMLLTKEEFMIPLLNSSMTLMMSTALLTKLGAAPFHFWFPEVIEGLSWMNSLILLTWQKIAPMMMLLATPLNKLFISMVIVISLITSTASGFNQVSLRKIMAFSSINHIAWMLSTMFISMSSWLIYFAVYMTMTINIILMFKMTNSFYMNQISNMMNNNKMAKFTLMLNFLSLAGLPPFIGFLPKWIVINWMTNNNMMLMTITMIITTLVMMFIYIRVIMSSLMLNHNEQKTPYLKMNNKVMITMNTTTLMTLIMCTMMVNLI